MPNEHETSGTEKEVTLVARILSKKDGEYELEISPGLTLLVNKDAVKRLEEYFDLTTGIPVARLVLREGQDVSVALRPRAPSEIQASKQPPFALTEPGSLQRSLDYADPPPTWETPYPPIWGEQAFNTTCWKMTGTRCKFWANWQPVYDDKIGDGNILDDHTI
jgi:hypothetical protein